MSFNTFGKIFRFSTWGESHGVAIGCVVDGCPPNIPISEKEIQADMNRRRPGKSKFTSQRKESDKVEILSGIFQGKTTGSPISMIIYNKDSRSRDYETIKDKLKRAGFPALFLIYKNIDISNLIFSSHYHVLIESFSKVFCKFGISLSNCYRIFTERDSPPCVLRILRYLPDCFCNYK